MAQVPHIKSVDDILQHTDMHVLKELTKAWHVDVTGCKSRGDVQDRLITHFQNHIETNAKEVRIH